MPWTHDEFSKINSRCVAIELSARQSLSSGILPIAPRFHAPYGTASAVAQSMERSASVPILIAHLLIVHVVEVPRHIRIHETFLRIA